MFVVDIHHAYIVLSRGPIGNNLSASSEAVVWTAYTLPSADPTLGEYTKSGDTLDQLPSPEMDALSKQTFSRQVDFCATKSLSSIMDIVDDSSKVTQCQQSSIVHRRNIDQAMCSKHPRRYFGLHYTRRRSAINAEGSTSRGGTTPFCDVKRSLTPASKCNSVSGHDAEDHGFKPWKQTPAEMQESKQSELHKPDAVDAAPSLLATNATSHNVKKQLCGICQKRLRKKRDILDSTLSSSEPSVVAVLVCGHLYHADCLEDRTHHEDATDPPCPICRGIN
ncbi:hypothetical protein BC332_24776 [Capsicum chinense]|nr:hypothetical protein BC332_24776 [Capsicum chinense]